jgi:cytochrome b561
MPHTQSSVVIGIVVVALVIWRVASRVRKLTSRQPVRIWSLRLRIIFLSLVTIVVGIVAARQPLVLASLVGGCAAGVAAGVYGLRGSVFENTADGLFYTPHRGLGGAIAIIFVARIGYRFVRVMLTGPPSEVMSPIPTDTFHALDLTPLTLGLFGLLAGYIVCYNIGILRWREKVQVIPAAAPVPGDPVVTED